MRKNKALVVGSVVFDEIFSLNGEIKNEIPLKNGKIENLNLMFTAGEKKRMYGGTAGNIAYGLGQLGQDVYVVSPVGDDFDFDYKVHLEKNNVTIKVFYGRRGSYTATFYGISDRNKEQIGIFQSNSYGEYVNRYKLSDVFLPQELKEVAVSIFSPGTGISTKNHLDEFLKFARRDSLKILDPGQELSFSYTKEILEDLVRKADIYIGNEVEIAQTKNMFGFEVKDLLEKGIKWVIETKGEKGAVIYDKKGQVLVEAKKPENFIEATGAGDAFRAGLIKGLIDGLQIKEAAELGAKMGALNVEKAGGQGYKVKNFKQTN